MAHQPDEILLIPLASRESTSSKNLPSLRRSYLPRVLVTTRVFISDEASARDTTLVSARQAQKRGAGKEVPRRQIPLFMRQINGLTRLRGIGVGLHLHDLARMHGVDIGKVALSWLATSLRPSLEV